MFTPTELSHARPEAPPQREYELEQEEDGPFDEEEEEDDDEDDL